MSRPVRLQQLPPGAEHDMRLWLATAKKGSPTSVTFCAACGQHIRAIHQKPCPYNSR